MEEERPNGVSHSQRGSDFPSAGRSTGTWITCRVSRLIGSFGANSHNYYFLKVNVLLSEITIFHVLICVDVVIIITNIIFLQCIHVQTQNLATLIPGLFLLFSSQRRPPSSTLLSWLLLLPSLLLLFAAVSLFFTAIKLPKMSNLRRYKNKRRKGRRKAEAEAKPKTSLSLSLSFF